MIFSIDEGMGLQQGFIIRLKTPFKGRRDSEHYYILLTDLL